MATPVVTEGSRARGRALLAWALLLLAVAAFHWGLWHQIDVGECGGEGRPECPPESDVYVPALVGGVLLSLVGGRLAGSALLGWAALLVSSPVALGVKAAVDRGPGERTELLVTTGVLVAVIVGIVVLLARLGARAAAEQRLVETGSPARAHVLSAETTGTEVNHDPRVRMRVRLEPLDGTSAFEVETTRLVDRARIPRVGDVLAGYYDPADRSRWAVPDPGPSGYAEETRRRFGLQREGGASVVDPDVARVDALERLVALRDSGALTEAEFEQEKRRLLA